MAAPSRFVVVGSFAPPGERGNQALLSRFTVTPRTGESVNQASSRKLLAVPASLQQAEALAAQVATLPTPAAPVSKPTITNEWKITDLAKWAVPTGWESVFSEPETQTALQEISAMLEAENAKSGHFVPDKVNLFRAFELTPLSQVRVVILGQDPYHTILPNGSPQAQGLSFSVPPGVKIPPSLVNIYKELTDEYANTSTPFRAPSSGCLEKWAAQGVLMLNTCLTTAPGKAGAHGKHLWLPFISRVFAALARVRPRCIYVMWGKDAQSVARYLGEKSIQLESSHPSPFSASRGFLGCGHFRKINEYLADDPAGPINWQL